MSHSLSGDAAIFRVKIVVVDPHGNEEQPRYYGPYTTKGSARGVKTREANLAQRYATRRAAGAKAVGTVEKADITWFEV